MSKVYADQNAKKKKKDEQNLLSNAVRKATQTTANTVKQTTTQSKPRTSASQEYLNSRRDMARNAGAEVANSVQRSAQTANKAVRRNQQYRQQQARKDRLQQQAKTDANVAIAVDRERQRQQDRQKAKGVTAESALLDTSKASRKLHENATAKTVIGSLEQTAGGHLKTIGDNANRHSYSMYKDWVNNEVATGRMSEEQGEQYLKNLEASPAAKNYKKWQNSDTRKAFSKVYEAGTKLNEMGNRDVQEASEGANGLKKAYLGAVNSGVGMLTDLAAGPAWALSMYSRTYGNNRGQVEALGGTTAQDMTNAGLQAIKETATEHLFMGVGLARGLVNRGVVKGMSIADRVGAKILSKAEGRAANLLSGAGRVFAGTMEENIEELAGWALDPFITEIAYGGDLRKREARDILNEQSADLLSQFPDEESARAAALYVGSDEFIERNKQSYMESGLPEKESQALAETMQEYMIATLTNDTETMLEKEQEMIKFMSGVGGISKDSWSLKELGETFASTTLLTATTGIPSAITTSQMGSQYQSQNGKNAVQALAKTAINLDPEMSAKAQAMQDRMDAGKDLTGTQVYDLMVSAQKAIQETSERANTAMQVAKKGIEDENLIDPVTTAENGSIVLGKITDEKYDADVEDTLDLIDDYNARTSGEEERLQLQEEDKELVADAVAAFNAGVLTPDHVYVLSKSNQAARNVFSEATGIDLNQYDVYDKNGKLDEVGSNINMQDALFAQAAQNYIESARVETAQWENEERGAALTSVSQRMESNGVTAVNNALLGVDARDRGRYLMTLRTADSVYHAARNTGEEWDDTKKTFIQKIAPNADIDALKAVYDAGLMDREAAEDAVRGKVVKISEAIKADNKANAPAPMLKVNTHTPLEGSVIGLFSNIVNITRTSIILSDKLGPNENGTYDPKTDTITLNVTTEGYAARNIGYTFMHEFTHHLQEYAPEEYQALKNAVRQRWEEQDPDGFKARIAAKIEQYKGHKELTDDRAIDELIADGVHEFLNDEQFVEKICDENPSLAKSIINAIRNVLRKLRQLFGMTADPMYKQAIFSQLNMFAEAEEMWLKAFQAAVRNKAEAGLIKWDEQARETNNGEMFSLTDADYMDAVERGDMETAQRMVDQAALQIPTLAKTENGKKPLLLFHGTSAFGFTKFRDPEHDVPFIYTSTNRSVSANYAGDNNYAGVRRINKSYRTGNSTEDIIENAKNVWGSDYRIATSEDKETRYNEVKNECSEVADKIDELWSAADKAGMKLPYEVGDAVSYVSSMFFTARDTDPGDHYNFKEDNGNNEDMQRTLENDVRWYKDHADEIRNYYIEHNKEMSQEERDFFRYLTSYDVGDAAIDFEYGMAKLATDEEMLINSLGGFRKTSEAKEALDQTHNIGAYQLYGDLGDNPFEFDAKGQQFFNMHIPEIDDKMHDTDWVCKWAYEHGYTSVIMHNIYDYGPKGDNYIFFDSSQLKSADPVTYDDNGNVIPLSERFNTESNDIRYSLSSSMEAVGCEMRKEKGYLVVTDSNGQRVEEFTEEFLYNSPLGRLLNVAQSGPYNVLSSSDVQQQISFLKDLFNMILTTQDPDLIWAVSGTIGYNPRHKIDENTPAADLKEQKSKFASITGNSDPQYKTTIDFTTICVKTQAIIDAMSKTMMDLHRGLTEHEIIDIVYDEVYQAKEQVPCPVCYVFSRWVGLGNLFSSIKEFQTRYPEDMDMTEIRAEHAKIVKEVDKLVKQQTGKKKRSGKARNDLYAETIDRKNKLDIKKDLTPEKFTPEDAKELEGIERRLDVLDHWSWLERTRLAPDYKPVPDEVLFDINAGRKFATEYPAVWRFRTSRGPALGKAAAPYSPSRLGDTIRGIASPSSIKKVGESKRIFLNQSGWTKTAKTTYKKAVENAKRQNRMNGQRLQSTSDFRFEYGLDYLLSFIELGAIGAKAQMYTKVPEAVKFLASVGAEVNCSIMPKGTGVEWNEKTQSWDLVFSDVTGMAWEDALALSKAYDNVQPILVAIGREHLIAAMASDDITMIIPYHASGSSAARYISMMKTVRETVEDRTDFAEYENEHEIEGATKEQKLCRKLRQDMLMGKKETLSYEESQALAKKENEILRQLYIRIYGKDENGNFAKPDPKYVENFDADGNDADCYHVFLNSDQVGVMMPYEYWDKTSTRKDADKQGKVYQDYCKSLGLTPVFSGWDNNGKYHEDMDFTSYPGYWKTLIDRCMYNNDVNNNGTYHKQNPVNVKNVDLDMLNSDKMRDGIFKPLQVNNPEKTEEIAHNVRRRIAEETNRYYNNGILRLDGSDLSEEYKQAVEYLNSGGILGEGGFTIEEYSNLPEIIKARQRIGNEEATIKINTPERIAMREGWIEDLLEYGSAVDTIVDGKHVTEYNGPVRQDKRLDIIVGLPSSGKSSALVDPISHKYKSRLLDADEAKKLIPENDGGWGAGRVHEESSDILSEALIASFAKGDNVVLPIVGAKVSSIEKRVALAREYGYEVHLRLCSLPASKAAARNLIRFVNTGRFVDLEQTSLKYLNGPAEAFEAVIQKGEVDGYTEVSNDVKRGENPAFIRGENDISYDWRDNGEGRGGLLEGSREGQGSTESREGTEEVRHSLVETDADGNELSEGQAEYFERSEARDPEGKLLPMYHFTLNAGFTVFDPSRSYDGGSISFTDDFDFASNYAGDEWETAVENRYGDEELEPVDLMQDERPGYYECYLNIENPLDVDGSDMDSMEPYEYAIKARHEGYDGLIIRNFQDMGADIYQVFSSSQVKDTRNQDPTDDPDIRYSIPPEDDVLARMDAETENVEEMKSTDPILEEGRVRMAKSKEDFFNTANAKWNPNWITRGTVFKDAPVKRQIRELVMAAMQNSNTEYQYRKTLVDEAFVNAKKAYELMMQGKQTEALGILWENAIDMIENVEFFQDDMNFEVYKEVRDYLQTTPISIAEEFYKDIDYAAFRKRNYGKLKLRKDGTPVEDVYRRLEEQWPWLFDSDLYFTPADQLLHIEDVIKRHMDPYRKAYRSDEAVKMATDIACDLYDLVYNAEAYVSRADRIQAMKDKYDQRTRDLKARHAEAMLKVRQQTEEQKQKTEEQRQRAEQWREKYRQEKQNQKAKREKSRNAREHAKTYKNIQQNYDWLVKRLVTPTKDKNIPEDFRVSLAHLLMTFDLQTVKSKELEQYYGPAQKTLRMRELKDRLAAIAQDESGYGWVLNRGLEYRMAELADKVDGQTIDALDIEDLSTIDDLLAQIVHNFKNHTKAWKEGKQVEIAGIGGHQIQAMEDRIDKYGKRKTYGKGLRSRMDHLVNEAEETPPYFFDRIDPTGEGLGAMYKELRRGEDRHIKNIQYLRARFTEICGEFYQGRRLPGSELEKWRDAANAQTFNLAHGSITLTPAQIMSLYCLKKREQALGHILGNGIVAAPISFTQKMSAKLKESLVGKNEQVKSVIISYEEVEEIVSKLSKDQKRVADQLQAMMSTELAEWGNEASMKLYNIKLFKDKDYFPIRSSNEVLAKQADSFDVQETIKNFGFTKPIIRKANNAIVIDDFFSVVADHCNKMSLYNAMAVPISDFMRVYNYKQEDETGGTKTVQAMIGEAFTTKANDYILKFIADVNGNVQVRSDAVDDMFSLTLANYKRAAIGFNARVLLQQPTAIFRAFMEINPKHFAHLDIYSGPVKIAGTLWNKKLQAEMEEMQEHCPISAWKAWGNYQMDFGRGLEDIMMNTDWSARDILSMGLYGAADNMTWLMIWKAVKHEVQETHPNLEVGSDEYWKVCNERASEVFDKTQVVDSVFHRSDAMRSNATLTKLSASFMAEPTLTFNVFRNNLVKSFELAKDGDVTAAAKLFTKMAAVLALNAAAVSASAAIWDAVRKKGAKKDEELEFWELWYMNFVLNFQDNINLLNNIYVVKDILDIKDGIEKGFGGTSNMALEGFETFFTGWQQAKKKLSGESDKGWYDIMMNLLGGFGYITGVPTKTIMRDAKALFEKLGVEVSAADSLEEEQNKTPVAFIKDGSELDNLLNRWGINLTKREAQLKKAREKEGTKDVKTGVTPQEYKEIMEQAKEEGFTGDEYNKRVAQLISEKSTGVEITVKEEKTESKSSNSKSSEGISTSEYKKIVKEAEDIGLSGDELHDYVRDRISEREREIGLAEPSKPVANQKAASMENLKSLEDKALAKAAGKTGKDKADALWDTVGDNYTHYVNIADWEYLNEMRSFLEKNGGDVNAFDQKVLDAAKVAYKKTLVEPELVPIELQRELYEYMTEHGVSQNYISSNILYKSYTASDLKAAFRMGNRKYIERESAVLFAAGLTQDDYNKLYRYRNYGAKSYNGKYSDPQYALSTGKYSWPATGEVTSGFGYRGSVAGTNPNHRGIDIGGNIGDPVTAADGGTVIAVNYGYNGGYGNQIKIRHDDGTITWYNHLSGANVNVGDTVGQGSQIGQIGATGAVTGPHLDFMVEVNGEYVDPLTYLKA